MSYSLTIKRSAAKALSRIDRADGRFERSVPQITVWQKEIKRPKQRPARGIYG